MKAAVVLVCLVCLVAAGADAAATYTPPFSRLLTLQQPPLTGADVNVTQHLLVRDPSVGAGGLKMTGQYDAATQAAVMSFQKAHSLSVDGEVGPITSNLLLALHTADGYVDDGKPAADLGYMYKMHVPVHKNRSIETTGTLYSANNTVLLQFVVRAHGNDRYGSNAWPTFNSSGPGLNQFAPDGDTPTGLMSFDLNSPEPIPKLYGPYPINRAVLGLKGNAQWTLPHIRNGILMHTGEWHEYAGWNPPAPMPNSAGCIHAWPMSIEDVWHALVEEGVQVRKNPFGVLPYPYKPQGLLSVELVHGDRYVWHGEQ